MLKKLIPFLLLVVVGFILVKCGQRGTPSGGPKDIISPIFEKSYPKDGAVNFNKNKIVFEFNEYVKVSSFYNEFVISPPVTTKPKFKLKGKRLILSFDTIFSEKTTYSLFLGNAVKDLNGGNVLTQNELVFSTGNFVDSLSYSGEVFDGKTMLPFNKGMMHLYKSTYDSVQTKEIPSYFTQIINGKFQFKNLAPGTYKIFGLVDINGNYKYDLPNEEISFTDQLITVDETEDSVAIIFLSFQPENNKQFVNNYFCTHRGEIQIKFNNPVTKLNIGVEGQTFKKDWKISNWNDKQDSLSIWSTYLAKLDSFNLLLDFDGLKDTLRFKIGQRTFVKDEPIVLRHNMNNMANSFKGKLNLFFNKPILSYDTALVVLKSGGNTQKIAITKTNKFTEFVVENQLQEARQYELEILPGAIQSVFGDTNKDTLRCNFNTAASDALSDLLFKYDFSKIKSSGILEFWSGNKIMSTHYINQPIGEINLPGLIPAKYKFKFIADKDGNKRWSSGDYWTKKHPEKVYWYKEEVTIRANWEMEIEWNIIPLSE